MNKEEDGAWVLPNHVARGSEEWVKLLHVDLGTRIFEDELVMVMSSVEGGKWEHYMCYSSLVVKLMKINEWEKWVLHVIIYIETWKLVGVEKRGRQGRERQERESLRVCFVSWYFFPSRKIRVGVYIEKWNWMGVGKVIEGGLMRRRVSGGVNLIFSHSW
jgi:hypothetical protein